MLAWQLDHKRLAEDMADLKLPACVNGHVFPKHMHDSSRLAWLLLPLFEAFVGTPGTGPVNVCRRKQATPCHQAGRPAVWPMLQCWQTSGR